MDYVLLFIGVAVLFALFALAVFCAWQRQRLMSWRAAFAGLSNAERVLLMWPSVNGKPVKQLVFMVDQSDDGSVRLMNGVQVMAKLPIKTAIAGQQMLAELVRST